MIHNKKAQVTQSIYGLIGVILALAIVGIVLAIFIYILFQMNSSMGGDLVANSTKNVSQGIMPAINALLQIPGWLALVVTVLVASIVIMMVMGAFAFINTRE